jgi:Uma2 family endonuclease
MTTALEYHAEPQTLADLLDRLGGVSPQRVRFHPLPGTATESDLLTIERRENRLCELVDCTLVEKAMGFRESILAAALIHYLRNHVTAQNLGVVTAPDGMFKLFPGLVRVPDVAFVSWSRLPERNVAPDSIPNLAPDLAVEILSRANTSAEMSRKRREYFAAGVIVHWEVDPDERTVYVYTDPENGVRLSVADTLRGEPVLPGFALSVEQLFGDLDRRANA